MSTITWKTNVKAPCCLGKIVAKDRRTILVQTDWDYAGTASTFGWSLKSVQRCKWCKRVQTVSLDEDEQKWECEHCGKKNRACDHDATDGTVDCKDCKMTATDFITAAGDWLRDNDMVTADDPGYFD